MGKGQGGFWRVRVICVTTFTEFRGLRHSDGTLRLKKAVTKPNC